MIDNEFPIAQCKDLTINLDSAGQAVITAADIDNGSRDNCTIASLSVSPSHFTSANLGPNTVTLKVVDQSGDQATCSSVVTVRDVLPPVLSGCPQNATYQCIARFRRRSGRRHG